MQWNHEKHDPAVDQSADALSASSLERASNSRGSSQSVTERIPNSRVEDVVLSVEATARQNNISQRT